MSRVLHRSFLLSSQRLYTTSSPRLAFATGPAPPRLPAKEQEEFERLQRSSTGAFSTPRPAALTETTAATETRSRPQINQSPASTSQINQSPASKSEAQVEALSEEDIEAVVIDARVAASGNGEELHPDIRRGAKPEFEGDINPVTGEIGGPKNEPLRWGSGEGRGDWSYNGRVTDF